MKAAQINDYGGKDVVKVVEAPRPPLGKGQVLVEAHAASVNPFDWKVRQGMMRGSVELHFPATLGGDVAGVIAEVGDEAGDFAVGQEVYGQAGSLSSHGSFAELVPVNATALAAKPKNTDFVQAAALPLTAASAYQALIDTIHLQQGQKILIHGGAGGIGSFAIQLAKHLGAYIATTVSAEDTEYVKELGADEAIDYKAQRFEDILHDFDAVFDTVGGETYKESFKVLKAGGEIVSMLESPDEALMSTHKVKASTQSSKVTAERLTRVAKLVEQGVLRITIDKTFPLKEAAEAIEYIHVGHHRGKVVITIA